MIIFFNLYSDIINKLITIKDKLLTSFFFFVTGIFHFISKIDRYFLVYCLFFFKLIFNDHKKLEFEEHLLLICNISITRIWCEINGCIFVNNTKVFVRAPFNKIELNWLFKLDLFQFTNFNELNDYLQDKYNIPAFQHRLLQRLSIFSFKILNFVSAPKILKEMIETKFQELESRNK